MKIYFTASPLGTVSDLKKSYQLIYDTIEDLGHKNLTDFILKVKLEDLYNETTEKAEHFYKKMLKEMKAADIVIFEVSTHSTGIGHQSSLAMEMGKPVIVLHQVGQTPYLFKGMKEDKLLLMEYRQDNIRQVLKDAIEYAAEQMDTRFNFFIAPKHQHYLDWISKKRKVPRAVHLRRLLEKDMEENRDYQKEVKEEIEK